MPLLLLAVAVEIAEQRVFKTLWDQAVAAELPARLGGLAAALAVRRLHTSRTTTSERDWLLAAAWPTGIAVFALPLAVFIGFVSTFIPAVGTYIGAAIPILVVLAVQGLTAALILLAWVLVYQQIENIVLSPRISADTMELNGAVAFGAALAGGAIAGPIGAFMSLPVAALITAIVKNYGARYDVVYRIKYADEGTDATDSLDDDAPGGTAATTGRVPPPAAPELR